ncbi:MULTISPECIES: restriction endonuclease subunit S [Campylobacter]|uniref:restriction endonuclease subunit S n=1 Tax=Campylobacter TaxID=194 RepID=UPI0014701FCC|nr:MULTISPECIES: restriction endonuclease subunit S [Campylobacter]MBN7288105.1 restriction endonuclease subunit S [Campylobacter curvus]MDU6828000.1 restriction endonuclease subunit S [Campylobacter sp.]
MRNKIPKHWQKSKFEDVLQYEQPSKYIVKSTEYGDDYKTPVLTAGKSFILGYTDEKDGIFTDVPVIIFDDFTTDTKFVDFHFKVKSSAMKILKPTRNTNIKFIFYLMQTIHHKSDTHKRYWISEYAKREIPLPPLDEQNLIVKKIESCFEKIDFAISNFKKSKELIEIYKQSVLSHAFNGKLTNSNLNSWQVKKLGEICEIKMGQSPEGKFVSDNLSNLKEALEFHQGKIYFSDKFILKSKFYTSEIKKVADEKSILLCVRAPVGIVNITDRKVAIGRGLCALKFKKDNNMFLYYFLINSKMYFETNSTGTTFQAINLNVVRNLEIPLPPLSEQNLIVSQIEKRFKAADSALNLIEQNLKKAEILKQSILSKAFNGELVKDKK